MNQIKEAQSFQLQLASQQIKAVLVYTNQAMAFRRDFNVALSYSGLKATLIYRKGCTSLDFVKAQTHLRFLNGLVVGECQYHPREANEVENEYYRSMSYPEARQLLEEYKALLVPRMAIRDILGDVNAGLKYYFVARDPSKNAEFSKRYAKLDLLRAADKGNKQFDKISTTNKQMVALTLQQFVCLRLLQVEPVKRLTGVVYKGGLYCDLDCQTRGLKELAKEYRFEETEMLLKHYLRITESPAFLDKFEDLGKRSKLIHQIQYMTQINRYCYFRTVCSDKVLYVRHRSCPPLSELLSAANIAPERTQKKLILEASDLTGQYFTKIVEIELMKHLKAQEIELVSLKNNQLLLVNYSAYKNVNSEVFALLKRLRRIQRIPLSPAVWLAFIERSYYRNMLSKLSNQLNIVCDPFPSKKGEPGKECLIFKGYYGNNPELVLQEVTRLVHAMRIWKFEIDVAELPSNELKKVKGKLDELAPNLKIRDPILAEKNGHLELSGVVLDDLHLEQTIAQLKGCLHPRDLDIMEVKQPFDQEQLELEDQSLSQTTLQSSVMESSSFSSSKEPKENEHDLSFNVSSVVLDSNNDSFKNHNTSEASILNIIPGNDRTVTLPMVLFEGVSYDGSGMDMEVFEMDNSLCIQGSPAQIGRQLDILAQLITESYRRQEQSIDEGFIRRQLILQQRYPNFDIRPVDQTLRQRAKFQWKLRLLKNMRQDDPEILEGFFSNNQPIRQSQLANYSRLSYGWFYYLLQYNQHDTYAEFIVTRRQ